MRILDRYLIKQHTAPFLYAFAALTGFMLLNQIARRLPMLLGKGLSWVIIVEFFVLVVPYLVVMTSSMSVLVAVLHTFGRLVDDSEITAMRASGVSIKELVRPVLLASCVVAFIAFLFGDQILPRTNHTLRMLMMDINRTSPTFSLKEHVVNEVRRGKVALRAALIDPDTYVMRDITVYRITDQNTTQIVYADSGQMAFAENQEDLQLVLFDGSHHELDRTDPTLFQRSDFLRYDMKFEDIGREFVRNEDDPYHGDREMSICRLEEVALGAKRDEWLSVQRGRAAERNGLRSLVGLHPVQPDTVPPKFRQKLYCTVLSWLKPTPLEAQELPRRQRPLVDTTSEAVRRRLTSPTQRAFVPGLSTRAIMNDTRSHLDRARSMKVRSAVYLVELHKKYAIPAACIVFVLVGIPVALRFRGGGLGMVIGVCMVIYGIFYIGLIAGESLANRLIVSAFTAMWMPNIVFGIFGIFALWRFGRQGAKSRRKKPGGVPDDLQTSHGEV